ncbi:MAG: phosphatase PAP2 family protein [Bacilli bacterium]|nr:phosphatase PAP2 family protein [Bacilli bacterium]
MKGNVDKKYILLIFLIIFFIIDTIFVVTGNTVGFDMAIYNAVRSINNSFFDIYFKFTTSFCDPIVIILLLVVLFINLPKKYPINCCLLVGSGWVTNFIIKNIIRRDRPNVLRLVKESGYSYPSAHAMTSIILYGYLIYLINKKISNKKLRISLEILLGVLIFSICISRIYVGVHFASDILGGMILGLAILILMISLNKKYGGEKGV